MTHKTRFWEDLRSAAIRSMDWLAKIDSIYWVLLVCLFVFIIRRAWLGDDAFITLRSIDNWVNGYGPNFNVSERVQAFTHPLWMLILAAAYFFTREPYFTTLAVSLICVLIAMLVFFRYIPRSVWGGVFAGLILISSNAFVDWSTSGLENPLSFLLLVLFCVRYFAAGSSPEAKDLFQLSLISSLAMLNRLDTGVIYLPMLVFIWFVSERRMMNFLQILLGQIPLIAWEMFALFYYGFPFPNTYYAKLHTGLSSSEVYAQGLVYFIDSFRFDAITLTIIFVTIGASFFSRHRRSLLPLTLGIVIYLGYILSIGGDFMSGRFFALPLFACAIAIARLEFNSVSQSAKFAFLSSILILNITGPLPTYSLTDENIKELPLRDTRISNERLWYDETMGLLQQNRISESPYSQLRRTGQEFQRMAGEERMTLVENAIGMEGFYAGPNVHIIDLNALSEPLLARLPMVYDYRWRPAHYIRWEQIDGYFETVQTLENQIKDPNLRTYYSYLSQIIHGDLWSWERIRTIFNMNLGKFDHLIDEFYLTYPEVISRSYSHVNNIFPLPMSCSDSPGVQFKENGLLVRLPEHLQHSTQLEIALENDKHFQILFLRENIQIARIEWFPGVTPGVNFSQGFPIPEEASRSGFDSLIVLPLQGEGMHCLGYVVLN